MRRLLPGSATFRAGSSLAVVLSLVLVLCLAAFLRFHKLGNPPPGLYVDEAGDAWDAWCLLKTGRDSAGVKWPVFYTRCFGDYRSALMAYAILPFLAVSGLSIPVARMAGAVAGVAAVFFMFVVGRRLFDAPTGLLAALFLAVSPWHIQQSRWVHPATLGPFLVLLPLALLLISNLVPNGVRQAEGLEPRPGVALAAGLAAGACCYGYPSVRVFLPPFLIGFFAVLAADMRRVFGVPRGRRALLLFLLGGLVTFGPLVFRHLTDPAIGKRGTTTWVWESGDGLGTRAAKAVARYPGHFSPDYLFVSGGPQLYPLAPPPGYGLLFWWMLPLILVALMRLLPQLKESRAARLLVFWLLAYPAADLLNRNEGMSVPRSLPGLPVFAVLAAVGSVGAYRWLAARSVSAARVAAAALVFVSATSVVRFSRNYFGTHDRPWDRYRYFAFQSDLLAAEEWLRPRFEAADAVVVTTLGMTHPYIYTLLSLGYDPARWRADEKAVIFGPLSDGSYANEEVITRFGKVWFLFVGLPVPPPMAGRPPTGQRTIFIVRPGQLGLEKLQKTDFEVRTPWGKPILWCFDVKN